MQVNRDRYAWQKMKKEDRPSVRSFIERPLEVFIGNSGDVLKNQIHKGLTNEELSSRIKEAIIMESDHKTIAEKAYQKSKGLKLSWDFVKTTKLIDKTY